MRTRCERGIGVAAARIDRGALPLGMTLALAVLLTGCSFLSRSQSRFYSLESIPGSVANVPRGPIGIDSVELPPGFDRREIVVRKPDHQLEVRATELWSALLEPMVRYTLALDLARRLPEGMVILPGAAKPSGPMRTIDLAFEEIAAGPDGKIVLDARWSLRQSARAGAAHHERITVDIASLDGANIASGLSQALAALADRIVAGLTEP
ncbi:MAG TPA: PqiC family protein [Thermoanaerobaculia bacterium]